MKNFIKNLLETKGLSDEELKAKLIKILIAEAALIGVIIITLLFFAPKLGFFFGLFSVHRNEKEKKPILIPNPPIFTNVPKAVNKNKVNLSGYAASGSTVRLFVNGPEKGKVVSGADGVFTFTDIPLNSGRNTLFAKLIDTAGNESDKTNSFTIYVDTAKPKIDIQDLKEGDTIKNLDSRIVIKGKSNEQVTMTINDKVVIINPDFTFEFILGVKEGEVKIKIVATDEAGNKSEEELKVRYQKSGV